MENSLRKIVEGCEEIHMNGKKEDREKIKEVVRDLGDFKSSLVSCVPTEVNAEEKELFDRIKRLENQLNISDN